jgi:hypothetical protein
LNASPELADALIADFRHRHNTDMGLLHKHGVKYEGHYDPWLDHEISKLWADILWASSPEISASRLVQDTDPLDFEFTKEKFGITAIPPLTRIANEFFSHPYTEPQVDFSSNQLWLSKLTGKRKDIYAFLAMVQQTKYAVTPLHTEEEFNLFHKAVSPGGQWSSANGQPNFDYMAQWWSEKANGKTIFYKLREHLAAHYKIWSEHHKEKQTMLASQPQRRPHEKRIWSDTYVSHVLPAAKRLHPGIPDSSSKLNNSVTSQFEASHDSIQNMGESSSSATVTQDVVMQDQDQNNNISSEPVTADITMQSHTWHIPPPPELGFTQTMPGPSNQINMQYHEVPTFQQNESSFAGLYTTLGKEHKKRRCMMCVNAGRDGTNCKGKNNRNCCEFK